MTAHTMTAPAFSLPKESKPATPPTTAPPVLTAEEANHSGKLAMAMMVVFRENRDQGKTLEACYNELAKTYAADRQTYGGMPRRGCWSLKLWRLVHELHKMRLNMQMTYQRGRLYHEFATGWGVHALLTQNPADPQDWFLELIWVEKQYDWRKEFTVPVHHTVKLWPNGEHACLYNRYAAHTAACALSAPAEDDE